MILFGDSTALSLACFSSQFESFLHLFGSQQKLFSFGFHNEQVAQGILASLSISNLGYVT